MRLSYTIIGILIVLTSPVVTFAQDISFQDINPLESFTDYYVAKYKPKFEALTTKYTNVPITPGVLIQFSNDVSQLENEFSQERREDYESFRKVTTLQQSCTNGVSGKTKVCPAPTITCPSDFKLVSEESFITGGGAAELSRSNTEISWQVSKSGKGRNEGTAVVHCSYSDDFISNTVANEIKEIKKLAGFGDS
ncbi:hypothetical protein CDG76_03335 [Nostoc sp. 'Peltigera membranacea cyanobiont' 210A]|uniref:hypothetical protein n=1 Tax=Nostoc sp. 'Peltigera membranacea cyanobiont' 210A TaxID=2014529 RepID=UPI000B958878|nr:hypothetical protein [Nostoc sp. 'Peltigera membranacea cyanobiont' 210A]OYD97884.1 hypothetical protein CDG76_03335 [Nostoc sp. 'Peltigera membranacea cyanobiont' 210A]